MKLTKILAATLVIGVSALATASYAAEKGKVGIAMPTQSSSRWISDGHSMVDQFKAAGFETDLQYAEDDIPNQLNQIENMVTKGVDVLVIASIDGTTLTDILAKAHEAGVKVFAYDRLIRNSPNVDYYSTFDNFQVGVLQASSLETPLGLKDGPVQHRTVRRLARRQQRHLLLQWRHERPEALHRQRQAGRAVGPDGLRPGRHHALGRRHRPGPHGQHPVGQLHRQACRRRAVAL
jgi:ABC-type xylose transport system substrate-binding protein